MSMNPVMIRTMAIIPNDSLEINRASSALKTN